MNESGDAGGGDGGGGGGGGGSSGGCGGGDDDSGGGGSWWNAGVGINRVLGKRADLATGVTCRDDQCRRSRFHPGKIPNNFLASRNYGDEINMKGIGYKSFKRLRRNA